MGQWDIHQYYFDFFCLTCPHITSSKLHLSFIIFGQWGCRVDGLGWDGGSCRKSIWILEQCNTFFHSWSPGRWSSSGGSSSQSRLSKVPQIASCKRRRIGGVPYPLLWLRAGNCWHAKPVSASQLLASQHALTPHGQAHTLTLFSSSSSWSPFVFRRRHSDPDGGGLPGEGAGGHLGNLTHTVTHTHRGPRGLCWWWWKWRSRPRWRGVRGQEGRICQGECFKALPMGILVLRRVLAWTHYYVTSATRLEQWFMVWSS